MKKSLLFSLVLVTVLISSCAKVYYSPEAYKIAQRHKIIAVAPPEVSIAAQKKVSAEAMKEQQKTESKNFQREISSWLKKRKRQGKFKVKVLDVATTNAKLIKAGHSMETPLTPAEMCEVLDVDGLLTSNFSMSKPMSEGAAVVVGLLVGVWGSTNKTTVGLDIYDRKTAESIWDYNHKASGGVGSSPADLVDNLMRSASRKMPYKGKK